MHRSQACHVAEIERALPRAWSPHHGSRSRQDLGLYENRRGPGTLAVETPPRWPLGVAGSNWAATAENSDEHRRHDRASARGGRHDRD